MGCRSGPSLLRRRESRMVALRVVALVHCVRPRRDFAPAGDPLFVSTKRGAKNDPCLLGRCCARAALRCSVIAGRAELTTRPAAAAFRQPPEVRGRRRCAPLQSPVLLDGSQGPQEQDGHLLRKLPLSTPRFASARVSPRRTPGPTAAGCIELQWIPAFAGMTGGGWRVPRRSEARGEEIAAGVRLVQSTALTGRSL